MDGTISMNTFLDGRTLGCIFKSVGIPRSRFWSVPKCLGRARMKAINRIDC